MQHTRLDVVPATLDRRAISATHAIAKILLASPRFVFLDRLESTLAQRHFHKVLELFSQRSITAINNSERSVDPNLYNAVLDYGEDGRWTWTPNPERAPPSPEP